MYDESVVVLGADDVQSPPSSAGVPASSRVRDDNATLQTTHTSSYWSKGDHGLIPHQLSALADNSDEDENEDDEDDEDVRAPTIPGCYDPTEYEDLDVTEDVKDTFSYIMKYIPQNVELENKLCPFLPDFIPAVGDVDPFIKIPRPDGKENTLGLTVLDEPSTQQSDSAVLQLQLRATAKQITSNTLVVKKLEDVEKNGKAIDKWIKAINDLHRAKPPPSIQYTKPMPNIDILLQEWPAEIDQKLTTMSIPNYDLDCSLSTYVLIICNMFDIPVYQSKIESLHTLFILYSTVKNTKARLIQNNESSMQ